MLCRIMPLVVTALLLPGTSLTVAEPPKGIRAKADSLFTGEQWKRAERAYRKLARHSDGEEWSYAQYRVGMCLSKQGDHPYAVVTWYDVFTYDRESEWSARAMEEAADTYIRQFGDETKGIWLYDWLVDRFPARAGSDNILHKVGILHFNSGNTKQALATFGRLLREYPESSHAVSARQHAALCREHLKLPGEVSTGAGVEIAVAIWHMDEGRGNVMRDSSGNGNDGTIHGARWVKGEFGTGLEFDGKDDHVEIAHSDSLNFSEAVTVEAWISVESIELDGPAIIAKNRGSKQAWKMCVRTDKASIDWEINGDWRGYSLVGGSLRPHRWYHVAGTYDSRSKRSDLYVNGARVNSRSTPGGRIRVNAFPVTLGLDRYDDRRFHGIIDTIAIYDRALSAEEILDCYRRGTRGHDAELSGGPTLAEENLPIPAHLANFMIVGVSSKGRETEFMKEEDCPADARRQTLHSEASGSVVSRYDRDPWLYPFRGADQTPRHFADIGGNIWIPIWRTWRQKWADGVACHDHNDRVIAGPPQTGAHQWTEVDYCVVRADGIGQRRAARRKSR